MKMNKWTLGLAAVGLVSLTSAVRADDAAKTTPLLTALSATTISGYVDTSMEWNPGTGNLSPAPFSYNAGKQDGFNLDSVDLHIAKPLEEGQWSSGYVIDLMFGPDANGATGEGAVNSGIGEHVRQAYLNLRMPLGNGLDWKIGRFDSPLGYESTDGYKNPNFTRSYGYTFEPTEMTGVIADYRFCESTSISSGGCANTVPTGPINARNTTGDGGTTVESKKAVIGMVNLTAPESWGAIGGSGLYAGIEYGPGASGWFRSNWRRDDRPAHLRAENQTSVYVGATIKTPCQGLTLGAAWDSVNHFDVAGAESTGYNMAIAGYASFKFTDKASLHVRGEYARGAGLGALADVDNGTIGNPLCTRSSQSLAPSNTTCGKTSSAVWKSAGITLLTARVRSVAPATSRSPELAVANSLPRSDVTETTSGTKKNEVMVAANLIFMF